jgi:ketosteroid isomerase-like protein
MEYRPMNDEEKKVLIQSYIDAYNRFDIDAMVALVHPKVVFKHIAGGQVNAEASGVAQFRALADQSKALFSSRRQEVTRTDFAGKKAFIDIFYEAELAVDLPNGMKAGERLKLNGQSQFEFKDGKIYKITDIS